MHDLTIIVDQTAKTVPYNDFNEAHRALMSHIIAKDLYLHPALESPREATTFQLVSIDDTARRPQPRVIGTATITPSAGKAVVSPYYSATAALRWTEGQNILWEAGSDTDPGARYPLAVLTAAHAEARRIVAAGNIYSEAAALSDAGTREVPRPTKHVFERLRDSAITAGDDGSITTPAELAAAVQAQLTGCHTAEQTAALIWYYALILWGVTAK